MTALLHETHVPWYVQQCTWLSVFSLGGFIVVFKDKIKLSCNPMWLPFWSELQRAALIWGEPQAGELWPRGTLQQAGLQPESWRTAESIESQPLPCDTDDNLKPSCCFGGFIPLFTLTQLGAECCSLTVKIVCGWLLFHMQWSICSELSKTLEENPWTPKSSPRTGYFNNG